MKGSCLQLFRLRPSLFKAKSPETAPLKVSSQRSPGTTERPRDAADLRQSTFRICCAERARGDLTEAVACGIRASRVQG